MDAPQTSQASTTDATLALLANVARMPSPVPVTPTQPVESGQAIGFGEQAKAVARKKKPDPAPRTVRVPVDQIKRAEAQAATWRLQQDEYVPKIRREHEAVRKSFRDALTHAARAGDLLSRLMDITRHGDHAKMYERLGFSERTAQVYQQIARRWKEIKESGAESIAEALAVIGKRKRIESKVTDTTPTTPKTPTTPTTPTGKTETGSPAAKPQTTADLTPPPMPTRDQPQAGKTSTPPAPEAKAQNSAPANAPTVAEAHNAPNLIKACAVAREQLADLSRRIRESGVPKYLADQTHAAVLDVRDAADDAMTAWAAASATPAN